MRTIEVDIVERLVELRLVADALARNQGQGGGPRS